MSSAPRTDRKPVTLTKLAEMRALGEPIVMVTAYDHPSAVVAEEAGTALGARCAGTRYTDPGFEIGERPPSAPTRCVQTISPG